jgi:signal transduction histidine kinase
MGIFGLPGPERPRTARYPIRVTFAAMVAVPVACLVLLWGVVVSTTLGGALAARGSSSLSHRELIEFALLAGTGLVVLLASAALMGLFAQRLTRDVADLEATARHLADERLPRLLERLRKGEQPTPADEVPLRTHARTAEIARAAEAIASLQHTAVAAATGEASLRGGIGQVFVSLARRNQSLLQRQLRLIDTLEQKATNPATLADLFPLDHLTTRMRRHAEGLIILSGAAPGRSWSEPVPVIDVIRGAVAEVEDYKRVTVLTRAEDAVAGSAAADMSHLLAELIENATLFSPSETRVEVRAERVANGFAIEIDDRGLGIEFRQMGVINQQLATPPDFDLANADQLGLFVVGKLAARHSVRVSLRPSPYGGTTAVMLMPNSIVVPLTGNESDTQPDLRRAIASSAGLDLADGEALALTGPRSVPVPLSVRASGQPRHAPVLAPDGLDLTAASAPAGARDRPGAPGPLAAGTYRGLPRRIRQASLSPHLKDNPSAAMHAAHAAATAAPPDTRTPEQARDLVSSLQSGWQRGRDTDPPDAEPATGTVPGEGSWSPQSEEA